jgi:hypothetical protein
MYGHKHEKLKFKKKEISKLSEKSGTSEIQ